jgi:hypothetical protein
VSPTPATATRRQATMRDRAHGSPSSGRLPSISAGSSSWTEMGNHVLFQRHDWTASMQGM